MKKILSTRVHGALDYLTAPTLFALPRLLKWNKPLTTLLSGAAIGTLVYSMMTRYELGLLKWLPMKGHLTLDFINGATLAATPFLLLDEKERDASTVGLLLGFGAFEIAASLLTETEPSAQADQSVIEQVRELVTSRS